MLDKVFKNPVISSVFYSIAVVLAIVSFMYYNIFIGSIEYVLVPFFAVFVFVSIVLTLFPGVLARFYVIGQLRKFKPEHKRSIDAVFLMFETAFLVLSIVLYMWVMFWGFALIGLVLVSLFHVLSFLIWVLLAGVTKVWFDDDETVEEFDSFEQDTEDIME